MLLQLLKEQINRVKFLVDLLPDACHLLLAAQQPGFLEDERGLLSKELKQFAVMQVELLSMPEIDIEHPQWLGAIARAYSQSSERVNVFQERERALVSTYC